MAKGGMCEKCQKNKATINFDIKGWRKWEVCDECNLELQTCSKCKKNPATNLITDEKGEKIQVCAECSKPQEVKCDDCKIKKATVFTVLDPNNPNDKPALCEECNQKRINDRPKGNQEKREQIKIIFEKVLERCPEKGFKPLGEHNGKKQWCVSTPIWVKRITKEEARELKELCQGANPKLDIPYVYWLSQNNYKYDFEKTLPQFIQELDKIIGGKESGGDKHKPKPDEVCEKCGASCIVHQTKTSYTIKRKRYIKHKTDFTRESSVWFSTNCPCAREFREANQQTCPQCKKREFPHMKRGWMLDYEIKKAFCSPLCHVTYRELKWEEAQRLTQVEMFPPELEVSANPNQNVDWEKEGLRNEVLFLRETVRELEQRLNNQTNLTPEERQQSDYLRNLQQNTLRNAESTYQNRYGSLNEDGSDKGKGMSGVVIALLIIGGIALVGGFIFLLTRGNKKRPKDF